MFANNIAPYQCRCYYTEQFHPDSRRVAYLQAYNIKTDHDVEQFIKQPTHDIDYYDIRLGNVCNLQCLMCGPNLSNQLYEEAIYRAGVDSIMIDPGLEIKKVDGKLVYDKQIESKIFNWADDNFFRDLEAKVVADLSLNPDKKITFYMIGGEPLLNEYHFRFLERLVELGLSKNITLEYNTNLTVVTDYIITLWSKFRRMVLAISIDDVGDRYEYIRYPSKWSKISNNLMAISQAIKQYPDVFSTVNVVAVVNFFTAYNFHTLVDTMSQYDINVYKIISTGPVVTTPAVLTDEEKQQYIELLKNTADRQELVDYVNSFTYNDDARKEFSHMLKFWESKRRKPFAEVFPELAAILKIN
jgi:sulfatase maturation enzyme AslB (radical SAM superfamily)